MKQFLTLILAITFLSLYSCKKEDNNEEKKYNFPLDSQQIEVDEKYANINWEELDLTDTCILDICFDCGSLDSSEQAFSDQLQYAFDNNCKSCLIPALDAWNSVTIGYNPENEYDTIQEIYKLFEAYHLHQIGENKSSYVTLPEAEFDYFLYHTEHAGSIKYNFGNENNEFEYSIRPRKTFGRVKLLGFEAYKNNCYELTITQRDNGYLPISLIEFWDHKHDFFFDSYNIIKTCDEFECRFDFGGGVIDKISFGMEKNSITKATITIIRFENNDVRNNYSVIGKENWVKDDNGNWVKEVTKNRL